MAGCAGGAGRGGAGRGGLDAARASHSPLESNRCLQQFLLLLKRQQQASAAGAFHPSKQLPSHPYANKCRQAYNFISPGFALPGSTNPSIQAVLSLINSVYLPKGALRCAVHVACPALCMHCALCCACTVRCAVLRRTCGTKLLDSCAC